MEPIKKRLNALLLLTACKGEKPRPHKGQPPHDAQEIVLYFSTYLCFTRHYSIMEIEIEHINKTDEQKTGGARG